MTILIGLAVASAVFALWGYVCPKSDCGLCGERILEASTTCASCRRETGAGNVVGA